MRMAATEREIQRLELQAYLDARRTQEERNRLGQFSTPGILAFQIVSYALLFSDRTDKIRFMDPAFGTGAFYSALRHIAPKSRISRAYGFEIDAHYGEAAIKFWQGSGLNLKLCDFRSVPPPNREERKPNLLICNPPYVRHHHLNLDDKQALQQIAYNSSGMHLSGLSGLYCYFLLMSHAWMADEGIAAWLIPSEFMDVNYGQQVKEYLLKKVKLLKIHRFDPNNVQFDDALVSSVVLFIKKQKPDSHHKVEFSYGGTLEKPLMSESIPVSSLLQESKWSRFPKQKSRATFTGKTLDDFFNIKRGLATGANSFFILDEEKIESLQLPQHFLIPILPSPRYLKIDEILASASGEPILSRNLYLLSCSLSPERVQCEYPTLWEYFQEGVVQGINERYLCRHRKPWYSQEKRPPAPLLCTYMGRSSKQGKIPFRFILNHSNATAANVYLLLYPKPELKRIIEVDQSVTKKIWQGLCSLGSEALLDEGRVYGGGLHKLEPKELAKVPANFILGALKQISYDAD